MEYTIYHTYTSEAPSPESTKLDRVILSLAKILFVTGLILISLWFLPAIASFAKNAATSSLEAFRLTDKEVTTLSQPIAQTTQVVQYQPRFDPTLPFDAHLKIPAIGVDTTLVEATYTNYEDALRKGVWRVSDFGTPENRNTPTILAAHRYGYLAWSNLFRRQNSFFNLPKLEVGDVVEIDWRQRKYMYEIYAQGQGEEIADYSADLILYTCETLNGPNRIFKYARLLEI